MNYNPRQLEALLLKGSYSLVEEGIIDFIQMNINKQHFIKIQDLQGQFNTDKAYQRECITVAGSYATLITKLFCSPNYAPSAKLLELFTKAKETLELIFTLSPWKNTDPIIDKLGLMQLTHIKKYQLTSRRKRQLEGLLALYCVGSQHRLPWKHLLTLIPEIALTAYNALALQTVSVLNEKRCVGYNDLLSASIDFPLVDLKHQADLFNLISSYFYCSYTTGEHKYAIKEWLAKLVPANAQKWLSPELNQYTQECRTKKLGPVRKMGVMLEKYSTGHAMFRCYNSRMQELSTEYHMVAFILRSHAKACDLSVFDEVEYIDEGESIDLMCKKVAQHEPDILFYPSIGMGNWSTVLAYLRLAPIQTMMGGHPSSSYSNEMDYFILPGNSFSAADIQPFLKEKAIVIDKQDQLFQTATMHPTLTSEFIEEKSQYLPDGECIKVGVNGIMMKVTADVINVCREIAAKTSKSVTFVFFSFHAKNSLAYLSTIAQLEQYLTSFELIPYSDYLSYLTHVSHCHLLLPTLPFGGANSNIDAMILKKPKLYIKGAKELYTRSDHIEWQQVGLDTDFGCDDHADLAQKAVDIIDDTQKRRYCHDLMTKNCGVDDIFYNELTATQRPEQAINEHFNLVIQDAQMIRDVNNENDAKRIA